VSLSVGVVILSGCRALLFLSGLGGVPHLEPALLELLLIVAHAFVVGFAVGYCPPVCLYLMMKAGLIDRRGPAR
jgi:hypothetical protein